MQCWKWPQPLDFFPEGITRVYFETTYLEPYHHDDDDDNRRRPRYETVFCPLERTKISRAIGGDVTLGKVLECLGGCGGGGGNLNEG
jgi:hypothetical protein